MGRRKVLPIAWDAAEREHSNPVLEEGRFRWLYASLTLTRHSSAV
jgi:hypothetical protein